MERIALWAGMDAMEYARAVRAYTQQFPNATASRRNPAVWKLRSCKGAHTGPDADFGPGEWLRTSALHAYFRARGFASMCADKPAARLRLEEQGALLLGFANATPGVQSCTFPVFPSVLPSREEDEDEEEDRGVIDLTEDDEPDETKIAAGHPAAAPGGSHWVLLLLRKQDDVIVGCELDPMRHGSATACATSVAVLRSWGATRIRAGWEAAMRMAMGGGGEGGGGEGGGDEGGGDEGVPAAPSMQAAGDTTECGPWVALLAHMASLVSARELAAAEAADAVAALQGNVCMYRALMYAACCGGGAGKRKRSSG